MVPGRRGQSPGFSNMLPLSCRATRRLRRAVAAGDAKRLLTICRQDPLLPDDSVPYIQAESPTIEPSSDIVVS